ncbi:MAG: type II secretion system F family protein [Aquabacterium sp.]
MVTGIWIALALMLLALAVILFALTSQAAVDPGTEKRFSEALETPDDGWLNQRKWRSTYSLTARARRLLEKVPGTDMQEVETLIRQAALGNTRSRNMVYASLWLTPTLTTLLALLVDASYDIGTEMALVFGFGIGFILPRKILRWAAERRKDAIKEEMPIVLNLMRLLFDSGLSLEHTLKAISEQAKQITPQLAGEFAWVLQRIHHGQERGAAMEEMAQRIDLDELTETVAILKQAARHGGSLRESLLRYLRLMEDRRLTDLKEKVSKLSAKMTVVMVAFMFPALMILLAGPGFIAMVKALKGII